MTNVNQVVIPNQISLNIPDELTLFHYFSLGEVLKFDLFKDQNTLFNAKINIVKNPEEYITENLTQYSTFYKVGKESIYYSRKYGNFQCKVYIDKFNSKNINIYVNKTYLNVVKFKLDSLYPVGVHLTDIFLLKIITNGDLVIHGASLAKDNGAFLLIAPPDTGKTYTTFMLLKKNYKFLGEDLSYYEHNSDSLMCMPYTSTWGHRFKLARFNPSKVPFAGLFINSDKKIVSDLFGDNSVRESEKLERIYILEKSDAQEILPVRYNKELFRKILVIQRNEFSYYKNPLIRSFEYFNDIDVDGIFQKEADSLKKLLKSKPLILVKATDHSKFYSLIDKYEKQMK